MKTNKEENATLKPLTNAEMEKLNGGSKREQRKHRRHAKKIANSKCK